MTRTINRWPTPRRTRIARTIVLLDSVHLYLEVFGKPDVSDELLAEAFELLERASA